MTTITAHPSSSEGAPAPQTTLALKAAGNAALAAGDHAAARAAYEAALAGLSGAQEDTSTPATPYTPSLAAVLQANRSAAAAAGGDVGAALASARAATAAAPGWPKAWLRLVRAAGAAGEVRTAAAAARAGMAAAARARAAGGEAGAAAAAAAAALRGAMDGLALAAAARGDFSGFDGAVLEVRPAGVGEEWLGLPAPPVPGEEEEEGGGGGGGAPRALLGPSPSASSCSSPRRSFRSLAAAVAAAADGDIIALLPGTHNGMGSSITVAKRVLITGGGLISGGAPARSANLDARANAPALRLRGACVLHGLAVEATGFREAIRLEPAGAGVAEGGRAGGVGGEAAAPLLVACAFRSAGDEAVAALAPPPMRTAGRRWTATLQACTIGPAKRAGLHVRGGAGVVLDRCVVERTGGPGVAVRQGGAVRLRGGCALRGCGGEGVVVSGARSEAWLAHTQVSACGGPCVDASGGAAVAVGPGVQLESGEEGGGGAWAWGSGTALSVTGPGTRVSAASTYALLSDGGAEVTVGDGGAIVQGGLRGAVAVEEGGLVCPPPPGRWVGPPPATGCFVWSGPDPLLAA